MKEKIKTQKASIQIPLLIVIIPLVISTVVGIVFPNDAKSVSLLEFVKYKSGCVPEEAPDPETGCQACGDNARAEYEQCRQAYYLKKQTQLLESQQVSQKILIEKVEIIKDLELKNQELKELLEQQNKQIDGLIQELEQENEKINTLTVLLKNAKLLNIGLLGILGIFFIYFIYITFRKKEEKMRCSQCKYLKKGEGRESFISPQGIPVTAHRGRFYCEADISRRFTDKEISILRECQDYRPSTLSLYQEARKDIKSKLGNIIDKIIKFKK